MAVTAFTLTKVGKTEILGRTKVTTWSLDCTNYNATTGIALTAAQLGLKKLEKLEVAPQESLTLMPVWDGVTSTAKIELTNLAVDPSAELATDSDAGIIRVVAYGK